VHEVAALPPLASWVWLVDAALAEDVGAGDATSLALLEPARQGRARVEAREDLVLCGSALAAEVFSRFDVHYEPCADDGDGLVAEQLAAEVSGFARGMLSGERTALNFLQHLSGIATTTRAFCRAVAGTRAAIVDTRKTTPGWRTLEKYAVRCGGGVNHRTGLYDGILIKDNHIAAVGSVGDAVKRARECGPTGLKVQIEVESLDQARDALEAGAEALLIDNQPPQVLREIVALIDGRVPLEATGGVNIHNVAEIARTGVDRISIGALTHSAPAADIALEWIAASAT
jgi:nicotinate-nucleotide pyrophosphorylase (carboxylating)